MMVTRMVRMVTIIHLPEGSTQPAVYMIQLGGTSPWSLQWGDQPYVRLGKGGSDDLHLVR